MKDIFRWAVILVLVGVYIAVAAAVLRPHVSPAYRAFYIDHTASDYNPVHVPGTPQEGISLGRSGLPSWVSSTHGFSVREEWGRWTDADLGHIAGLTFVQPFNEDVCLDFSASAVPWMVGKTIEIRFGTQQQHLRLEDGPTEYRLPFVNLHNADRLDFVLPPKLPALIQESPAASDPRRLGILLDRIRIVPGACAAATARMANWP